jgi:hypothetical protein
VSVGTRRGDDDGGRQRWAIRSTPAREEQMRARERREPQVRARERGQGQRQSTIQQALTPPDTPGESVRSSARTAVVRWSEAGMVTTFHPTTA